MKAPERKELLEESQAFIERETTFVTMPLSIRWFGWWLFTEKKDAGLDHAGRPRIPYNPLCHRGRRVLVSAAVVRIDDHHYFG